MKSVQKIFLFIMISLCMASAIMATEGAGEAEQGPEEDITYPGSKFYTPEDNVRSKVLAGFADQIMRLLEERKVTGEPVHLKDLFGEEFTLSPETGYSFTHNDLPYHAVIFTHSGQEYLLDAILFKEANNALKHVRDIVSLEEKEREINNGKKLIIGLLRPLVDAGLTSDFSSILAS